MYEQNEDKQKQPFRKTKLMFFTLDIVHCDLLFPVAFFFSECSGELHSRWGDVTLPPSPSSQHKQFEVHNYKLCWGSTKWTDSLELKPMASYRNQLSSMVGT